MDSIKESVQEESHTLLFVDDEENILHALRRVFRKEPYKVLIATSGKEGLPLLEANPVALVISDHRMPEMEGTEFLSRVREMKPDVVRIMLTGYADMKAATEAINNCQAYRFIAKPWNDDDLRITVREALRQYDLATLNRELTELVKQQNQELYDINRNLEDKVRERTREVEDKNKDLSSFYQRLEASFLEMVHAFLGLMELKSPSLIGRARRVADLARKISIRLGLSDDKAGICEMAALLMDIGTIGYPDNLIRKREQDMDTIERTLWQKHPLLGEASLNGIDRLKAVLSIIRSHHERFDGKGFPDGLRADLIPLPARIIAAADYLDCIMNPPSTEDWLSVKEAVELLEKDRGTRLDPSVVHALIDITEKDGKPTVQDEVEVPLENLAEDMTLASDLKTRGGILLLPARSRLQALHLEKIKNFHRIDPIVDRIYILRKT